jgi:hypothetical protein
MPARELEDAMSWLLARDTNPMWPEHAAATLHDLRRRLGHGL